MAAAASTMYGGADLISGLCDDLLLRILELLPDARDTVRTGALSRRWRGLWTRLRSLRFSSSSRPELSSAGGGSAQAQRFVSFVSDALALRAAQTEPAVEHLAISFAMTIPRHLSFDAAQGWIRIAAQNEVKSFVLELHRLAEYEYYHLVSGNKLLLGKKKQPFVIDLEDLRSSSKMETMRLSLGDAKVVQLPAAAKFASLVELSLENMEFADGNGPLLNRFLSTACCPRLQKLSLRELRFTGMMKELLLEAEALLELFIEKLLWEPYTVRLRSPSLRVLRMVDCNINDLTLSAPMLEELFFLDEAEPFSNIDIIDGELPCIRSLKVQLDAYAYRYGDGDDHEDEYEGTNGVVSRLLNCCTSVKSLDVDLYIVEEQGRGIDIIEGRIPRLPEVTSLTVNVYQFELHSFGGGIPDILTQCSNLKYLRVCCIHEKYDGIETHFLCDHQDHWKPHDIYLRHLKEAEFTGLVGTECELRFIQSMFTGTTQLQKATINFDPKYSPITNRINVFMRIQSLGGGTWTFHENYLSLEWKPRL